MNDLPPSGIPPVPPNPPEDSHNPYGGPPPPPYGAPENFQPQDANDKNLGMISHLIALSGLIIPFGNIIGPLVIWLTQKEKSPWIDFHAKESLNFQITLSIAMLIGAVLILFLIGFILLPILAVFWLVMVIVASIKASEGVAYRYPFTLRLLK